MRTSQDLLSTGELTSDGAEFAVQQLTHSRNQLIAELASLEVGDPHESASPSPMSIVAETRGYRKLLPRHNNPRPRPLVSPARLRDGSPVALTVAGVAIALVLLRPASRDAETPTSRG